MIFWQYNCLWPKHHWTRNLFSETTRDEHFEKSNSNDRQIKQNFTTGQRKPHTPLVVIGILWQRASTRLAFATILSIEHDHLAWNGTRHLHKRPNPPLTLVNLDQSLVLIFSSIPQAYKLYTSITPVNGFFANLLKSPLFVTTCISEKHIDDGNHSCHFLRNSTKMVLTRNYFNLLSVCVCFYGLFLDFYQNVIIGIVQKWSNKCMMLMKKIDWMLTIRKRATYWKSRYLKM